MNLFEYAKKYQYTFDEKEFNEVDNLVFSILSYVDFNKLILNKNTTIKDAADIFNKIHIKKEFKYEMMAVKDGIKLFNIVKDNKRYKNIRISNYAYIGDEKEQFSAITFDISDKVSYISFEGTDKLVSGWKEDAMTSYVFPVPSQRSAIKYLNKYFTFSNKKLIIGGHSKGGNLALVSSMYCNFLVQKKIIRIYSNDGQGLRKDEIDSKKYMKIYDRYNHIIPYNSFVGILLRHESFDESLTVDSNKPLLLSHSAGSWIIDNNHFIRRDISSKSIKIDKIMSNWLDKYDYFTRKEFIDDIFNVLKKNNITEISQFKKNITNVFKLVKYSNDISKKSKNMINELKVIINKINNALEES